MIDGLEDHNDAMDYLAAQEERYGDSEEEDIIEGEAEPDVSGSSDAEKDSPETSE